MKIIMLTQEQTKKLQDDGFSFEEIRDVSKWLENIRDGKTLSKDEFWKKVYVGINTKMKKQENV